MARFGFGRAAALLSFKGYESLKSYGVGIVVNKLLRDEIIGLFETDYRTLEFMDSEYAKLNVRKQNVLRELFYDEPRVLIPFNHERLFTEQRYIALLKELKQNRRSVAGASGFSLRESQRVLQLIKDELGDEYTDDDSSESLNH